MNLNLKNILTQIKVGEFKNCWLNQLIKKYLNSIQIKNKLKNHLLNNVENKLIYKFLVMDYKKFQILWNIKS